MGFIDDIIKASIAIFVIGIFIWMLVVLGDITQQDVFIPIALLVLIGAIIILALIITIIKVLR